jgi:hypothetical protein
MSEPAGWPSEEETPAVFAHAGLASAHSSGSVEAEPDNEEKED